MKPSSKGLVLNIRARTLTGEIGGKFVNIQVQPGSGLLAQVKPGRYTIHKPVNDPAVGWIAAIKPAAGNPAGPGSQQIKADSVGYASVKFANSPAAKFGPTAGGGPAPAIKTVAGGGPAPAIKHDVLCYTPKGKFGSAGSGGGLSGDISFIMTTSSMGGWNDLVLNRGDTLMSDLEKSGDIELEVV